jgi:hypothetical protein
MEMFSDCLCIREFQGNKGRNGACTSVRVQWSNWKLSLSLHSKLAGHGLCKIP